MEDLEIDMHCSPLNLTSSQRLKTHMRIAQVGINMLANLPKNDKESMLKHEKLTYSNSPLLFLDYA